MTPRATYRLQLCPGFGFAEAAEAVPYLARLGVSHLYLSPILQAVPGSTHGYDVVDHSRLSDDLGGAGGFARLRAAVEDHDLGVVVDVVPNHMALAAENRWWWDVLEEGPSSIHADHFDIDWRAGGGGPGAVLVPVLDDHVGRVIDAGGLVVHRRGGSFVVQHHDQVLPLAPTSTAGLVAEAAARSGDARLAAVASQLAALAEVGADADRHAAKLAAQHALRTLTSERPAAADALDAVLAELNADPVALGELLDAQHHRLAWWRVADDELDYRRFFDITTLAGLRVEDPSTFAETHRLILELVAEGVVDGLRLDHVDGLRDPTTYLERLRAAAPEAWIVVEKILERSEELPAAWPVDGTTGYELIRSVGDALLDPEGLAVLEDHAARWTGEARPFEEVAHEARLQVTAQGLAAEVERVTELLLALCSRRRRNRDHTRRTLRTVVRELAATLPVYRTYATPGRALEPVDRARIAGAVAEVRQRRPEIDAELLELVERALCLEEGADGLELAMRFQQLSAPTLAKGVEDTAFYRWVPHLVTNEVGGDAGHGARGVEAFHAHQAAVAERHPRAMVTLATHDTKRSADVRARLAVLAEPDVAHAWVAAVDRWGARNVALRAGWEDPVVELVAYQTLVGAWPLTADRLEQALVKSANEAKQRTSWTRPDPSYDAGLRAFAHALVEDAGFVAELEGFLEEHDLVRRGRVVSLAQVALELTVPGVPDVYQGDEVWSLSLVDPDNRRPVDLPGLAALLDEVAVLDAAGAWERADAGAPKLWLVHKLLRRRREVAAPAGGAYAPLAADGPAAEHVVAFAHGSTVTVVPRVLGGLGEAGWAGTTLELPAGRWRSVLDGGGAIEGVVPVEALFERFPVAVLGREG